MLNNDAVHDIGDVIEAVHHLLKMIINLVADKKAHRIALVGLME